MGLESAITPHPVFSFLSFFRPFASCPEREGREREREQRLLKPNPVAPPLSTLQLLSGQPAQLRLPGTGRMGGRGRGRCRSVGRRADRDCKSSPHDRPTDCGGAAAAVEAKVEWPPAMVAMAVATAKSFEWVSGGEQSSRCACGEWCYYPPLGLSQFQF